jgi:hypothetical protein
MGRSINRLVFLMGTHFVFCEDVTEFSTIILVDLMLEMVTEIVL